MKRLLCIAIVCAIAATALAFSADAQQRTVSGVVMDSAGEPLPAVSVYYRTGKKIDGTMSGMEGEFSMKVPDGTLIAFR